MRVMLTRDTRETDTGIRKQPMDTNLMSAQWVGKREGQQRRLHDILSILQGRQGWQSVLVNHGRPHAYWASFELACGDGHGYGL